MDIYFRIIILFNCLFEGITSILSTVELYFTLFLNSFCLRITSILSTVEPLSFSIQNKFGLITKKTMTILCAVGSIVSMLYATAFGDFLLGIVDTFINQIAILIGVVFECIVFVGIFKAEKLIDFLNKRSKTLKLGKWWLVIVKYILPIFITIVWIGGMVDVINTGSFTQLMFIIITVAVLLIVTLVLTILSVRNSDWSQVENRI